MELGEVYFYTVAIADWTSLLKTDQFKTIILESLAYLVNKQKLKVYGFVIMPNHIHIIWENIEINGKEMPYVSFMKFTGHKFLDILKEAENPILEQFKVKDNDRNHKFWQSDGMPKLISSRKMLEQKLDYIHLNPLQEHWNLVNDPNDYYFSSCSYYELEDRKFDWLTHYMDVF
ncbi:transposase [Mucilaginibacter conchicola]|uniref:Transposase n=1 Tax=Mucilaginibacter conchicola TaxID=2303333 RepID=A0A372NQN1_9SPHI|nr:transposase [Mucilaginibacter conchicola]RFZ90685.1 transposase [Mucilaginibacter conchicola]